MFYLRHPTPASMNLISSSDLPGLEHLLNGHTFNNIGSYGCLLERFKSK